jgi:transposase-like protein
MKKTEIEKEAIIAEYLTGISSYRKLGGKYQIDFRMIHSWVKKYQGKSLKPNKRQKTIEEKEVLPNDVKQLQEALRMAKLHNKLLNNIIDIAEEQLQIDIRKKSGTKR